MNLLLPVLLAMTAADPAAGEDAQLAAWFKAHLDAEFQRHPYDATRQGDHRFDHLLDDLSPDARAADRARTRAALADLKAKIDPAKLTPGGKVDFDILAHHLEKTAWLAEHTRPFEDDPRTYNEYTSDSVFLLLTQSTLPKPRNVANAIARMAFVPKVVAAARASLGRPPRVFTETAVRQNRGAIQFYEKGVLDLTGEPADGELARACKPVVAALRHHQEFLEKELLPRSDGDWRLGREKFARKLELELDAGLTADEVLREAEAEADRVEREMAVVARQMWAGVFPGKPVPPDDPAGRRDMVRKVLAALAAKHGPPEALVTDARAGVERIKAFIRERDVLRLPEPDRCRVIEMPEFQRGNAVAYLNPAPPLDPAAGSFYAISPPPRDWDARRVESFLEEYNAAMLQILTIHEAYPGHYVQLEYGNRHPSLIRKVLYSGVFAEGWAVYTEQMMLDEGYGGGDLGLRLHQLKWYLRAVCNAILDHRMHCSQMTDEQAMELLTVRAFQSEGEAVGKIVRSKQSSCQLSTYFVGRTAFYRLRQAVSREQGDAFDLGRFHEAALAQGTLPVKFLPALTRERLKAPR